jgi:RimJ/RimL family protein N-acetyltransferase
MEVKLLDSLDVDVYLRLTVEVDAGSGVDGEAHSHPYSRTEPLDMNEARARELTRWSAEIESTDWRRAWGLFELDEMVGSLYLAGGALHSESHRVSMGMGIRRSHRRRGGGTLLLRSAIKWARGQPTVAWIDLGVFSDNPGAQALYGRHGFETRGHTPDRFRVDGVSLDDTSMSVSVAGDDDADS